MIDIFIDISFLYTPEKVLSESRRKTKKILAKLL
jgi:hypothetical protein